MADETVLLFSPQIKRYLCFGDTKYLLTRRYEKIGRNKKNHIKLDNLEISDHHAVIKISDNNVFIQDLNSKNGTQIDDTQLTPCHYYQIQNNNIIKFANSLEGKFIEVEADTNNSVESNNSIEEINENSELRLTPISEPIQDDNDSDKTDTSVNFSILWSEHNNVEESLNLNFSNANESAHGDNSEESINESKTNVKNNEKLTIRFSGYYLRSKDKNKKL